jgi:hypothetical protein
MRIDVLAVVMGMLVLKEPAGIIACDAAVNATSLT